MKLDGQMMIDDILAEWEEKQKVNADAIAKQKAEDEERLRKEREEMERRREAERIERERLEAEAARKAAGYLVGEHDFASFCADCTNVSTTVRTIYSLEIENCGDSVTMLVKGNGFLYNMIRIIAGTLIDVSEKRISPDDIPEILSAKNRLRAGRTAMAHGLYLNRVFYSADEL
jgi:tRNA pseudouridine(38-40) synthase